MLALTSSLRYYMYYGAADMRKGFNALCGLVRTQMNRDPLSGEVFIFVNRNRTTLKILHWERGGLVIYHKRLEQGLFSPPKLDATGQSLQINWTELMLMVEGVTVENIRYNKRYSLRGEEDYRRPEGAKKREHS